MCVCVYISKLVAKLLVNVVLNVEDHHMYILPHIMFVHIHVVIYM